MTPEPTSMTWHDWLRSNQGVGVIILVGLAVLTATMLASDWVYIRVRDGFHLGFFPLSAIAIMMITALGIVLDKSRRQTTQPMQDSDWQTWVYPWVLSAVLLGFFWLMREIGFVLSAPLILAPAIYLLGARPARSAIVASLLITVSVYIAFRIIGTNIPQGPLPI